LAAHQRALALRRALADAAPGDTEARRELGRSELAVGETLAAMGRHAQARASFARSRAIAEALDRERPEDRASGILLGDGVLAEGASLFDARRLEEARSSLERARATYDRLVAEGTRTDPGADVPGQLLRRRAICSYKLGQAGVEQGRAVESLDAL